MEFLRSPHKIVWALLLAFSLIAPSSARAELVKSPSGGYIPVMSLETAMKKEISTQSVTAEQLNEIRMEMGRKTHLLPPTADQ